MPLNDSDLSRGLPAASRCAARRGPSGLWLVAAEVPGAHLTRLAGAVDLGYLDEPTARPGLAHLLEHALFLGSQRWPETDALGRWVGEQGGRYNAYTGDTATDVHLQLPPAAAGDGLARLCELLARPCFDPAPVEREVAVLDAEFHARLADPELHRLAALGQLCCAGHAAQQCHAGHAASLVGDGAALAAALRALHRHYRPRAWRWRCSGRSHWRSSLRCWPITPPGSTPAPRPQRRQRHGSGAGPNPAVWPGGYPMQRPAQATSRTTAWSCCGRCPPIWPTPTGPFSTAWRHASPTAPWPRPLARQQR
nr:insulinase family protein [Halomonas socia]